MATSVAGTYFTSWEYNTSTGSYQLGPIVVIGPDNSVAVDGVPINGAMVLPTSVSWLSGQGNPSSAQLQFQYSSQYSAMCFSGYYWTTADSQPSSVNIYGFATQPAVALSAWNNTYNCYESTDNSGEESLGTLIISSPNVTFAGKTIINPIYTGLSASGTDTCELAWYTSDGNDNNAAISFFNSTQTSGVQLFNGDIWPSNESRPEGNAQSVNNFFGTTQEASDDAQAAQVAQANGDAQLAHAAERAAVGAAVGFLVHVGVGQILAAANKADAQNAAENAGENAAAEEDAAEDDAAADAGDDAADAGEDAADAGEDAADEVTDDLLDALAGLEIAPDGGSTPKKPRGLKKASGLSAKQLLALKNRP
jgi:hypothetical protein